MHFNKAMLFVSLFALTGCGAMDSAGESASGRAPGANLPPGQSPTPSANPNASRPPDAAEPPTFVSNPFVVAESDPFATFAADVDTASYDIFRRSLGFGALPNPSEVRPEEYINYFHYDYPLPAADSDVPFTISLAASAHISGARTKLLRVGIQGSVAEKRAMNLVFLVDISGSMAPENKLPLVRRVLREALEVLDPEDTVAIVTYAGATSVALAPTPARQRSDILAALTALEPAGGTNGASGIELAYQQANAGFLEDGINHVVLCTDGDFNLGVTSDDALVSLIEQKRKSGVTLTALGFGERNNDSMMERVSNAGNGIYSVLYNEDQAIAYVHQRLLSNMIHIAKDVKIQLEFNPQRVHAYRLVGYDDRLLADDQFRDDQIDAGEVGSGHQVTALFELALSADDLPPSAPVVEQLTPSSEPLPRDVAADDLVRVSVRFKRPGAFETEAAREVAETLAADALVEDVDLLDDDAVWAMGVASLAERLRSSPYAQQLDVATLQTLLATRVGDSKERAELHSLLPQVRRLLGR